MISFLCPLPLLLVLLVLLPVAATTAGSCENGEKSCHADDNSAESFDSFDSADSADSVSEFLDLWNLVDEDDDSVWADMRAIWLWLGCNDEGAFADLRTDADYVLLVDAYVRSMAAHGHTRPGKAFGDVTVTDYNPRDAFKVPVELRRIPEIGGRGVFVLADVKAGEMVWRPTNAAEFPSRETYRDFFAALARGDDPVRGRALGCDVLAWAYATVSTDEENYVACCDFDHSSLMNYPSEGEEANVGQKVTVRGEDGRRTLFGCQEPPIYALRDIKAGEEVRIDYGEFAETEGWQAMEMYSWG